MPVHGFRFCFTPLTGVLFAFPSRYCFAIGSCRVFSLGSWSTRIQAGFHVPRPTQGIRRGGLRILLTWLSHAAARLSRRFCYPSPPFVRPLQHHPRWFGLLRVRSPLLAESRLISVPVLLRWFTSHSVAPVRYLIHAPGGGIAPAGLPHSDIRGSRDMCSSPRLFAACRALLRLAAPRHPPWTYTSLGHIASLLNFYLFFEHFVVCFPSLTISNIFRNRAYPFRSWDR